MSENNQQMSVFDTFSNVTLWCQSYLRDPRDREKPLILRSYQREVTDNSRDYNNIILRWGRRMGKCSYINDLCVLSDGTLLTFGELLDKYNSGEKIKLSTLTEDMMFGETTNSIFIDNGKKSVYEVITKSGRKLKITKNHPLLTPKGWKKLENIKPKDSICVPSKIDINSDVEIDDYKVKTLAYLLSDGSITTSIRFGNEIESVQLEFLKCINDFDCDYRVSKKISKYKEFYVKGKMLDNKFDTNHVVQYIKSLNLFGKNSHKKFIPNEIMRLSKRQQSLFLSRLYACDGWASVSKSNRKSGNCEIGYCSVSEDLAYGVAHLLMRFGIRYFIKERNIKYKGTIKKAFQISIRTKPDILKFLDEIGIFGKENACENVRKHVSPRIGKETYFDSVPFELVDKFKIPTSRAIKRVKRISKFKILEYAKEHDIIDLVQILNSDTFFDEIESIRYVGKEKTVEVQSDPYHNYIQNDVIVHNSVVMCADCLWWASAWPLIEMAEKGNKKQKPFTVLVFAPYESQVKELWNTFTQLIGDSPLLKDQVTKIRTSDVHRIEFKNGSEIKGYTIGISSSNQGTSLRGLSGDMIFIDEMDFIPTSIIEQVILPITTTHKHCRRRICSTPSGARELYFKWCWPYNSKIQTLTGIKNISDIRLGDKVFGIRGVPETVTTLYKQPFNSEMIKFKTGVSEEVMCTPNHELFVYGEGFIPAERLTANDYILVPTEIYPKSEIKIDMSKYYFSEEKNRLYKLDKSKEFKNYADASEKLFGSRQMRRQLFKYRNDKTSYKELWPFNNKKRQNIIRAQQFLNTIDDIDRASLFKLIGYYLAEGNILKYKNDTGYFYGGIQLTFNKKETSYISECCDLLKKLFNKKPSLSKNRKDNSTSIFLYSSWISYVFIELCGEYSHQKRIHPSLLYYSDDTKCILDGYINGDGFRLTTGKFSFVSTSFELARQLHSICISNNIPASFRSSKKKNRKSVYTIYQLQDGSYKYKVDSDGRMYTKVDYISKESYGDYVYNLETNLSHTYNVQGICSHNCTQAKELGWLHIHHPSWHPDNDNWMSQEWATKHGVPIQQSTEFQVKSVTSSDAYRREYGGEFGEEFGGVYKHHLINKSLIKYGRNIDISDPDVFDPGFEQRPEHKYIIGVDWNSYINGGQIVMLEFCSTPTFVRYFNDEDNQEVVIDFTGKYRLFYRRGIKSKDSTQRLTRMEVIRLLTHYKVDYLYVDYGAGDTNIEELTLYGREHPELGLNRKLRVIDSGATVDHYDHILQKMVKKRNKSLMINFSVISLEEGFLVLPKEEDNQTRLVGQMRGYKVKHVTARGEYAYEGEDHILDAFNLAIYGFQQNYGQLLASRIPLSINYFPDPRQGDYPIRSSIERADYGFSSNPFHQETNNYMDPEKQASLNKPVRIQLPRMGNRTSKLSIQTNLFGRGSF